MKKLEKGIFKRIDFKERVIIEERYCKDDWSMAKIAEELKRPTSTVSREIDGKSRKGMGKYSAERSESKHVTSRKNQGRKSKIEVNEELKKYIVAKMKLGWSPEQISIRLPHDYKEDETMRISYETVYEYVYKQIYRDGYGYLKPNKEDLRKYLPRRHKRRSVKGARKAQKTERLNSLPSIEDRPLEVDKKIVVGHWEGDTLVSKQSLARVKSMNERVTGVVFFGKTNNGTTSSCDSVLINRLRSIPHRYRKTITQDRGTENMGYREVEKELGAVCYFAHPYSSHERGANENANGLLRRFFPKKTDFSTISDEDLARAEYLINSRPRVRLQGLTPYEYFYQRTGVALDS
jgi:IS30 family transposase